jgi:hypothetical protein
MTNRLACVMLMGTMLMATLAQARPAEDSLESAPTDSILEHPEDISPWMVRGTKAPLSRRSSTAHALGRSLMVIPETVFWLASRPATTLINWDERKGASKKVMSWFTRDVQPINTRFSAYLGYESGFGMTVLGLRINSDDWYGTGLQNRFRFSFLSPHKNIVEMKFAGGSEDNFSFSTRSRFKRVSGRDYYGSGLGDAHGSDFDSQIILNEIQVRHSLIESVDVALLGYSRATRLLSRDDDELASEYPDVFSQAEQNHYLGLEAELRRDTRDSGEMSTNGSLVRIAAGLNAAQRVEDSSYRHITAEWQGHRPLFRDRTLAVRLFYEGVDADAMGRLPFTELRGLGGRSNLRGYDRDRFRNAHLLAASAEYRYPVTKLFQGRLFSDWGTTASTLDDIDLGTLHWSGGLGLLMSLDDDVFIIQYAHGDQGGHFFAGTSTPFGYESRRKR